MIRSNPWYVLMPLCLGITACTENRTPAEAPAEPAKSAAAMLDEPTFESIPTPDEMIALLRESLRDPVDTPEEEQSLQQLQEQLGTFTYERPNTMVTMEPIFEGPMGKSYLADREWAAERLEALYGEDMEISCLSRPCIQYGDFDGDGKVDLVVQVGDDESDKTGIAFLLADQTHALLGAGHPSPVGDDLIWADAWKLVPHSSGKGSAVVLSTATQTARAELSPGTGPDGSHEVSTLWACAATPQVPAMTGLTTPSGLVTRSGTLDGSASYEAWQLFDTNKSSLWISETWTSNPVWVGYEWSDGPRSITRYALTFNNGSLTSRAPRDFTLQGWDGSTWVTVDSRTGETQWAGVERRLYTVSRPGSYGKYRLHITDDNDDRAPIVAISLERFELIGGNCTGSTP
ncbi:FG-GAP repeat protein [Archangium gephyra]|uniref:hypothetical protein n=1 Tax=Archangium gephyra TaxID=48 RepID=UPI0035D48C74